MRTFDEILDRSDIKMDFVGSEQAVLSWMRFGMHKPHRLCLSYERGGWERMALRKGNGKTPTVQELRDAAAIVFLPNELPAMFIHANVNNYGVVLRHPAMEDLLSGLGGTP